LSIFFTNRRNQKFLIIEKNVVRRRKSYERSILVEKKSVIWRRSTSPTGQRRIRNAGKHKKRAGPASKKKTGPGLPHGMKRGLAALRSGAACKKGGLGQGRRSSEKEGGSAFGGAPALRQGSPMTLVGRTARKRKEKRYQRKI